MPDPRPDPDAPFGVLLAHLIQLLRNRPEQEAPMRETLALLVARVARSGAGIEAGIENSWALDGDPLKERLQARQVDDIQVAPGASADELLLLARALADDTAPVPSMPGCGSSCSPTPCPSSSPVPAIPCRTRVAAPFPGPGREISWPEWSRASSGSGQGDPAGPVARGAA